MDIFAYAVAWVLKAEGAAFVNDRDDPAHYSKYGITLQTLSNWRAAHGSTKTITPDDVASLAADEASRIYRVLYWPKIGGDRLSDANVACVLLNAAVLIGPSRAVEIAQGVLGVKPIDGIMGPKTLAAVNMEPGIKLIRLYVPQWQQYLYRVVQTRPAQLSKFFLGWMKRTDALLEIAIPEKVG